MLSFSPRSIATIATLLLATLGRAAPSASRPQPRDSSCVPAVAGQKLQIQSPQNSSYVWTLFDCTNPGCVQIAWAEIGASSPDFTSWYAAGGTGSAPPLEISTAGGSPGGFCITAPRWGATLGGAQCVTGEVKQEFQLKCQTCSSSTAALGTACQVVSWDWGQCVTSNGLGEDLSIVDCDATSAAQTWNIVQV